MKTFEVLWQYHSQTPPERVAGSAQTPPGKDLQPQAIEDDGKTHFQISLQTDEHRPNHQMTIRTDVEGWNRDIHGVYWWGAWRFALPKADYRKGAQYLFYLDGKAQVGTPGVLVKPQDTQLSGGSVKFAEPEQRFLHSYENLRVREDEQQQNLVRSSFSESVLWDVIVIGSGMGGGVLADALTDASEKDIRVLVLDVGCLDYATHVDNLPVTGLGNVISGNQVRHYENINKEQRFGEFVQMNLGGRSVYWSGLIPRMRSWELSHWPDSIRRYLTQGGYDAAEKLMRKHAAAGVFQERLVARLQAAFPGFTVVDTPRSCHQPEFASTENPQRQPESFLYRSTGTFSAAELLLDSMNSGRDPGKERLFINLNHLVTELNYKDRQITGVVCQDLIGNRTRAYSGKVIVLAAGSLESAKIALRSRLKDSSGLIGRGLTDHPSYYAPDGYHGGETFYLKTSSPYAGPYRHARIFFYPDNPWEGHWFNVEIVLNGQFWRSRHADNDILELEHPPHARSTVNFKFVFGSPLQEDNYVALGATPDARLQVKHAANPSGQNARDGILKLAMQLADFFQVEPVNWANEGNCHFGNGGTVNHAGGTLRMGKENDRRVVDENLKFVDYDNLYVCDPSAYPYIPAANPSLTLAALSLRLANHLAEKF